MALGDQRRKLAALPGVRSVRRPVTPGAAEQFDLDYVRTGPAGRTPLVIIPGGPGMASIAGYQGLRRRAAEMGLDVIMVEHRGVGLSRRDDSGADLPPAALTIEQVVDDVAAVLDHACVSSAVVYGASYGSYLAAGVGVRHGALVQAMVLDSPLLNRHDFEVVRSQARDLLWNDDTALAAKVRALTEAGSLEPEDLTMAAAIYGVGGADLLERHLDLLLDGRRLLWKTMRQVGLHAARRKTPYRNEADLVAPIGFRELNFAGTPDGLPLDTVLTWRNAVAAGTPFEHEPFDLVAAMPGFGWPTVVISGGLDLITPGAVADRISGLVADPAPVRLPTAGHSALDIRQQAALRIAGEVVAGNAHRLPAQARELDALPAESGVRIMSAGLAVAARVGAFLPRLTS
ncbi:MAG: alpha/beta fold hydrolase [Mycobacterium sp.]